MWLVSRQWTLRFSDTMYGVHFPVFSCRLLAAEDLTVLVQHQGMPALGWWVVAVPCRLDFDLSTCSAITTGICFHSF